MFDVAGEICEQCGFVWDALSWSDLPTAINTSCSDIINELTEAGAAVNVRPRDGRWSTKEYASHVRDVLLSLRERIVLASVMDKPTGTALYRDDRVAIGLYARETSDMVARDITMAGSLLARTVDALPVEFASRTMIYSAQTPMEVSLWWVAQQAVHELRHHLGDVVENTRLLNG